MQYEAVRKIAGDDKSLAPTYKISNISSFNSGTDDDGNAIMNTRVDSELGAIIFPYQENPLDLENDEFFVREYVEPADSGEAVSTSSEEATQG